jgi:toxin ParE1/3/4
LKKFKPIKISNPAEIDLKNIADYTSKEWGELQKYAYLGLFKQSFISLNQNQGSNKISPLVKDRKDIDVGLLSYGVKKHVVYFRETEQELLIVRVLHSRMDPEKHLL